MDDNTRAQAVKLLTGLVKPLVWISVGKEWLRAVTIFGNYNVMWGIEPDAAHLDHGQKLTRYSTIEAAKAAAEADYTARIIAALNADAIAALVGALRLWRAFDRADHDNQVQLMLDYAAAVEATDTALARLGGGE